MVRILLLVFALTLILTTNAEELYDFDEFDFPDQPPIIDGKSLHMDKDIEKLLIQYDLNGKPIQPPILPETGKLVSKDDPLYLDYLETVKLLQDTGKIAAKFSEQQHVMDESIEAEERKLIKSGVDAGVAAVAAPAVVAANRPNQVAELKEWRGMLKEFEARLSSQLKKQRRRVVSIRQRGTATWIDVLVVIGAMGFVAFCISCLWRVAASSRSTKRFTSVQPSINTVRSGIRKHHIISQPKVESSPSTWDHIRVRSLAQPNLGHRKLDEVC